MLFPSRVHLIFCLVMRVTYVTGYTYAGSCAPDCMGEGDGVVDPFDCHNYYICQDGQPSESPIPCSDGKYFDSNLDTCVTGTCTTLQCIPDCNFELHRGSGYIAHRTDCNKYYNYNGMLVTENECLPGHYFNGLSCSSTDENECCDPCLVYCDVAGSSVADPLDCTKYYYCAEANYFPETPIACPSHIPMYNFFTGECETTSSCIQLCSNSPIDPPDPNGCTDSWTCVEEGFFPACPNYCSPNYFSCNSWDIGGPAGLENCLEGQFINPDTDPLTCVPEAECPYPPYP